MNINMFRRKEKVVERHVRLVPQKLLPQFELGKIVYPANVDSWVTVEELVIAFSRHISGDWGEVSPETRRINDIALKTRDGRNLFSQYFIPDSWMMFGIVTDLDNCVTAVIEPDETFDILWAK